MKNLINIEKKLEAAEKAMPHHEVAYKLEYTGRIRATEQILTNMPPDDDVYELRWPNESHSSDSMKLKWLGQYTPEQIEEMRSEWMKSNKPRAVAALKELNRLLTLVGGPIEMRRRFLRRKSD